MWKRYSCGGWRRSPLWVGCRFWLPWDRAIRALFIPERRQLDYCPSIKPCLLYQMRAACEHVNCNWAQMAWVFIPSAGSSSYTGNPDILMVETVTLVRAHSKQRQSSDYMRYQGTTCSAWLDSTIEILLVVTYWYLYIQTVKAAVRNASGNLYSDSVFGSMFLCSPNICQNY